MQRRLYIDEAHTALDIFRFAVFLLGHSETPCSWLFDLVWLNKASIPNFSFLGSLEVAQIYLSGWVGGWVD